MKSIYITLLLTASLLFQLGCGKKAETPANTIIETPTAPDDQVTLNADQMQRIGLQTAKAERRQIKGGLKANGVLDVPPQNMVSISAPFGGFLTSTPLLQGSRVSRGQQIAVLQDPAFVTMQQQYLEDRSQLAYLSAEYERQKSLSEENVNARKTLEKAKADFESMKARIAGQRAKLEMLNINLSQLDAGNIVKTAALYAPISGYVTQVHVNIGSHVNPEDVLFKIADTGHLHAELTVYEQDLPLLAINQKVHLRTSNAKDWRLGSIHLIGREVGEDRSVKVHVHLDEEDTDLVPGTYLEAEIEAQTKEVMTLPNVSIVQFEGQAYIFVPAGQNTGNKIYKMIPIETGLIDEQYTEVIFPADFNLGTEIVAKGSYELLSILKNTEDE